MGGERGMVESHICTYTLSTLQAVFLDDFLIVFSFVQINQCVESRSNRNLFSFNFSLFENRLKFGFKIAV